MARAANRDHDRDRRLTRRGFLATAAGMAAAGSLGAAVPSRPPAAAAVPALPKRTLGRTGLKLTTFSLGTVGLETAVIKAGLARGINFVHSASGYNTLDRVAEAMAGRRDKPYLGLKYERPGQVDWDYLNRCLQLLKVDHVDLLFFPLNSPEEARNRTHLDFFNQVKQQKKARFIGITSHGNVAPTMRAAVEAGFWDVLMPSYIAEPAARAELQPVLDQAEKKKLGVVAMKTMTGLSPGSLAQMQTVVKEVLADSSVTAMIKGMLSFEQLDAFLAVVGKRPTAAESEALRQHLACRQGEVCMICGRCPTCPQGVSVFEVVRAFDYYYAQQGFPQVARTMYAEIPHQERGSACDNCGECDAKCPYGVSIARHVQAAHLMLG